MKFNIAKLVFTLGLASCLLIGLIGTIPVAAGVSDSNNGSIAPTDNRSDPLTDRQLALLEQGVSKAEISRSIGISIPTIYSIIRDNQKQ